MRNIVRIDVAVLMLAFGCVGCVPAPEDITATAEVQSLNIVGQCLTMRREATVYRLGRPFRRLVIDADTPEPRRGGPGKRVAVLPAGTRVRIAKVYYAAVYNDGLFQIMKPLTFARVESGAETGRLVDLGWSGLPSNATSVDNAIPGLYARCPDEP